MRARKLVLVGTLAGSLASLVGASAGSPAAAAHESQARVAASPAGDAAYARTPRYTAADLRSPAAWRAARVRVERARLRALPHMTAGTVVVASYFGDDALPIGDVDHDGTADVLSVRVQARTQSIDVLSGRTGRALWSRPDPTAYAAIYVAAPNATPMVLVLSDTETGEDALVAGAAEDVFTVASFRADHGTQLWSTSITGAIESDLAGFRVVGAGEFDGVLTRKAAPPYVLLDRFSEANAFVAGGVSVSPEVIDTAAGAVVSAGQPIGGDSFAFASPVDDLNGDGTDDYVVATSGDAAAIEAASGTNGAPLWAASLASPGGSTYVNFVRSTPDLTGDHRSDLLAGWSDGSANKVAALAGTTGTVGWSHPGDYASPLGDIDRDGRSDTRVLTWGQTITYAAVNATGHTVWSRTVSPPRGRVASLSYPVGDLNGDGAVDTYLRVVPDAGLTQSSDSFMAAVAAYVVDGRTGRLRVTHDLGLPSGDSLSGHAMTFVQTLQLRHGVRVTAFDGRSGRALWHISLSSPTHGIDVSVLPLSHNRRGIVEILGGNTSETIVLFDGKRGAQQWMTAYQTLDAGAIFFV